MDYAQMMAKMWRGVGMGITTIIGLIAVYCVIAVFERRKK